MTEPDNSILCTCGPWNGPIPPPPCPVHRSPEWHDQVREWATTTPTTPVFTKEMIRRAMGQKPCDVSDVPFCGWGDLIPELPTFLGSVWSDTPLDFDGVDDRLTTMQQITPSFSAVIIGKVSDESQEHLRAFTASHYGTVTTVDLESEPAPPEDEGMEGYVAYRVVHPWGEWWHVATWDEWVDDTWTAKCGTEADARRIADALNAAERASTEEDR